MRNRIIVAALAALVGAAPAEAGNGQPISSGTGSELTLAVYGDAPYGTSPSDTAQFDAMPAFIDSINDDPHVGLVLHVGDIHSGKQYCTESYDRSIFGLFARYKDPLVYTPGDNEWTDCHKVAEGGGTYNRSTGQVDYVRGSDGTPVDYAGGDPVANLGLVRSIFFASPGETLGGRRKRVLSQADAYDPAHPTDAQYVENVLWEQSRIVFATLNVPGGSNNDTDPWYGAPTANARQTEETAQRTGADVRWLQAVFDRARADRASGVLLALQADMWDPEKGAAHQSGYEPLVRELARQSAAFGGPVLMLNGDSHVFRSDNPLSAGDPLAYMHPGYDVPNFHRIVVHGSTAPLEWLRLTVDTEHAESAQGDAFGPFSWERVQP